MVKKLSIVAVVIAVIAIIGLEVGFRRVVPYGIVMPHRVVTEISPADFALEADELSIKTIDSLILKGYVIHAKQDTPQCIIILVHGIGSCKEHMFELASELSRKGIASVVFDVRAHGESEGKHITYGYKEKEDIKSIVDVISSEYPDVKIGIWGNSLGGAIALQAMEIDARLAFGIIESTFRDFREIVSDYQKNVLGVRLKRLTNIAINKSEKIADYQASAVKPIVSVTKINVPVLIAHGDQDHKIAVAYGKSLFDKLSSTDKELVVVSGGNHSNLFEVGGEAYKEQLFAFIERQLNTH